VQDLWAWMKRADVFVSLSDFEGHPNAVLEALACGCRLVVSDIQAHRSVLDDEVAVFVNPADLEGIRRAIGDTLDLDDGQARAAAVRACRHARRWSVRAAAEQYDALYRQVLGSRSVPAGAI
jgi:glycosyltransferase involved in cell wall biosynthesis